MARTDPSLIRVLAAKYVWWMAPDEAARQPRRVVAQVMNLGDFDDVKSLADALGDEALRDALHHAQPGQFKARSWAYWHYRLGLAELERVPPLPQRRLS